MTDIVDRLRAGVNGKDDLVLTAESCEAADEIEGLRDRVRQLTFWYDQQMGTPCEQIRHEQEIERLREELYRARCGGWKP